MSPKMRILLIVVLGLVWVANEYQSGGLTPQSSVATQESTLQKSTTGLSVSKIDEAFRNQQSDLIVVEEGRVIKVLPDDTKGSQHQRFLVKLNSGLTVLIAHNIDLAPRVSRLKSGDFIRFKGEYEWNEKGGVVHWTHHDPAKRHAGGWVELDGKRYE
nr:DUF3465 domain-containing protein [Neptunomonas qingdaonensis]